MAASKRDIQEVFVGEELRASPTTIVLSNWLSSGVPSGLLPADAQFPATFDRSVWPREEDLTEGPLPARSEPRNILELTALRPCEALGAAGSQWRLCVSLATSRGHLARSVREACDLN